MALITKKKKRHLCNIIKESFVPNDDFNGPRFVSDELQLPMPVGWGSVLADGSIKRYVPPGAQEVDELDLNEVPPGTIFQVKGMKSGHATYRGRVDEIVSGILRRRKRYIHLWRDLERSNFRDFNDRHNYLCEGLTASVDMVTARPDPYWRDVQHGKIKKGMLTLWPYFSYELDKESGLCKVIKPVFSWDEPTAFICVKYPTK